MAITIFSISAGFSNESLTSDCTAGETIWIDASGKIISTFQIWENTTKDADSTQVYRLVAYTKDDPGVLALGLSASDIL